MPSSQSVCDCRSNTEVMYHTITAILQILVQGYTKSKIVAVRYIHTLSGSRGQSSSPSRPAPHTYYINFPLKSQE